MPRRILSALATSLMATGLIWALPGCGTSEPEPVPLGKMGGAMDPGKMGPGAPGGAMDSGGTDGATEPGKMEPGAMEKTPK